MKDGMVGQGAFAMNRAAFQALADIRIAEAQSLLAAGFFDGAYYLAGYAVECALKACIARLTNQHDFPDKEFAQACYTHDIEKLVRATGLTAQRDADAPAGSDLAVNWDIAKDWAESSRYERNAEPKARALIEAVIHATNGVLPWIKARW
jgi:HEPN domain-containing protein